MARRHLGLILRLFILAGSLESAFGALEDRPLEVVVEDSAGAPIAKAHVRFFSIEGVVEADTDAQGRARFRDIAEGTYDVEVEAKGFQKTSIRNVQIPVADRNALDIVLEVGTGICGFPTLVTYQEGSTGSKKVWGRVVDADSSKGISRATVTLFVSEPNSQTKRSALSDQDGRFQFTEVAGGRYSIGAGKKRYESTSPVEFLLPRKNAVLVELSLDRKGHMHVCQ